MTRLSNIIRRLEEGRFEDFSIDDQYEQKVLAETKRALEKKHGVRGSITRTPKFRRLRVSGTKGEPDVDLWVHSWGRKPKWASKVDGEKRVLHTMKWSTDPSPWVMAEFGAHVYEQAIKGG